MPNRMEELNAKMEEARQSLDYQAEVFFLDMSQAFCQRLIELGYGHDTGELYEGKPFFQIGTEEVPEIEGVSRKTIKQFMEGECDKVSMKDLFLMLWAVGIVLEPHHFMGQSVYYNEYPIIQPKGDDNV